MREIKGRGRSRGSGRGRGARGRGRGGRSGGRGDGGRGRGRAFTQSSKSEYTARGKVTASQVMNKEILQNGEKGAETFTVPEAERIRLTRILMDLREQETENSVEFPSSLTNTERRFVHELALQLGLKSKSTGKGENRKITVRKPNDQSKGEDENDLPTLQVGHSGEITLRKYFSRFPMTELETLESRSTGESLSRALTSDNDSEIGAALDVIHGKNEPKHLSRQLAPKSEPVDLERRRLSHATAQERKRSNRDFSRLLEERAKLPAFSHRQAIIEAVEAHPVTIIEGETGSGKSTQIPQFLLDANPTASIVVTQPRRISAISIAERVAREQCLGDNLGGLVGYQVRLEAAMGPLTQLLFVTPGILLRKLQSSESLEEYSHIVIDEVHERDRYTEFMLIVLRDMLPKRPDLRVVLMSATMQTQRLYDYFAQYDHPFYKIHKPFQLKLQGRMYPVQQFFLEDVLLMTGHVGRPDGDFVDTGFEARLLEALRESENDAVLETCSVMEVVSHDIDVSTVEYGDDGDVGLESDVPTGTHEIDGVDLFVGDMEEYDLDEKVHVDEDLDILGNDSEDSSAQSKPQVIAHSKNVNSASETKWDGVGIFQVETGTLGEKDEVLTKYQAVTDDEQIDFSLLLSLLRYIDSSSIGDGAILVFLPGWAEISESHLLLESTFPFSDSQKFLILPLHSGIPSKEQRLVLRRPPNGVRKIILSTNLAETSLTIDDVAFVVDSGRAKEKNYDPHLRTSTLQPTWISQASSKQRKGRAGRTKAGVCFHLFSMRRFESLKPFLESEILRTPLEELCLLCKKMGLAPGGSQDLDGVASFLAKAMSPPHQKSISNALELLVDLAAMEPETNELTDLGHCLSALSLEPRVGRMVIWSYFLGCAEIVATMATSMSYKSPFAIPPPSVRVDAERAKVRLSQQSESDQLTAVNVLQRLDQVRRNSGEFFSFCRKNYLIPATINMVSDLRRNLDRELGAIGFPKPTVSKKFHNRHGSHRAIWEAALAAGLYPNVATRKGGDTNFVTVGKKKAKVHIGSVNSVKGQLLAQKSTAAPTKLDLVCFGELVMGSKFFTMSATTRLVSPLPLILFCGSNLTVHPNAIDNKRAVLTIDDWISFTCDARIASQLVILRKRLEATFRNALMDPSLGLSALSDLEREAINATGPLLKSAYGTYMVPP